MITTPEIENITITDFYKYLDEINMAVWRLACRLEQTEDTRYLNMVHYHILIDILKHFTYLLDDLDFTK